MDHSIVQHNSSVPSVMTAIIHSHDSSLKCVGGIFMYYYRREYAMQQATDLHSFAMWLKEHKVSFR